MDTSAYIWWTGFALALTAGAALYGWWKNRKDDE